VTEIDSGLRVILAAFVAYVIGIVGAVAWAAQAKTLSRDDSFFWRFTYVSWNLGAQAGGRGLFLRLWVFGGAVAFFALALYLGRNG